MLSVIIHLMKYAIIQNLSFVTLWSPCKFYRIHYKSMLGFMGIYGKLAGDINPHKSSHYTMGIYGKPAGDINPHKSP